MIAKPLAEPACAQSCKSSLSSGPFGFAMCAIIFAFACCMLIPSSAFASSFFKPAEEPQDSESKEAQALADDIDASVGVFAMVHEAAYFLDGSECFVWDANLDEHGNAVRSMMGPFGTSSSRLGSISDSEFDELGGLVSSTTKMVYVDDGVEMVDETVDHIIIVDERSGRVDSYANEENLVLYGYGESGKIEQITILYGLYGSVSTFDERGLPVQVDNIEGCGEDGQIIVTPWAQIEWVFDDDDMPAQVCVRNANTGVEQLYPVVADEYGNVIAILRPDGSVQFEFAYEYVKDPSSLVAAMPPEYLSDIVLVGGVPE